MNTYSDFLGHMSAVNPHEDINSPRLQLAKSLVDSVMDGSIGYATIPAFVGGLMHDGQPMNDISIVDEKDRVFAAGLAMGFLATVI